MPFDAYKCYLAMKNHFTKDNYDYQKYRGKVRATNQAFYKRKDRFWFEKFARQKNDKEVEEFFVSNFVYTTDPATMWIGEMIKEGENRYIDWKKRIQSLSYIFKEEANTLFDQNVLGVSPDPFVPLIKLQVVKYFPLSPKNEIHYNISLYGHVSFHRTEFHPKIYSA